MKGNYIGMVKTAQNAQLPQHALRVVKVAQHIANALQCHGGACGSGTGGMGVGR